jgi:phospho-N-acetylmuramoyl-pentapeptide-transferase
MIQIFTAIFISFLVSVLLAKPILMALKRFKLKQTILHYVEAHQGKAVTPTMGGILFLVAIFVVSLVLFDAQHSLALVCIATMLAFGILGFMDDFIKVKLKQNEGLKPYQKLIGQVAVATVVALFCYNFPHIGSSIAIPFSNNELNLGIVFIPFVIFVFLAVTNAVNLTDGLDGLAGGVSLVYFVGFSFVLSFFITRQVNLGIGQALIGEYNNLLTVCGASIGALLAYLIFNSHPAVVFMGDTGSLGLGGLIASVAVTSKLSLFVPILGILFVLSAVSVLMQVFYYKRTKKRIFKMAPLHHHFEKSGMNETKIVAIYMIITAIVLVAVILFELLMM